MPGCPSLISNFPLSIAQNHGGKYIYRLIMATNKQVSMARLNPTGHRWGVKNLLFYCL
jgi:hypothetical protein